MMMTMNNNSSTNNDDNNNRDIKNILLKSIIVPDISGKRFLFKCIKKTKQKYMPWVGMQVLCVATVVLNISSRGLEGSI